MILHILKKDVRRLWPAVAVSFILLATLARADRWRADWTPSLTEGWLNLLLPFAWACLVALVVQEEALVGDRQFWITRPYRWPALLAAKLIFILLFIHLPSFLADAAILAMRGFPPLDYLPQLLGKQALLAGAVTLPALAVSAVVRNFTLFVLAALAAAAEVLFLAGFDLPITWHPVDDMRHGLIVMVLAGAALAIVGLQYSRRQTLLSRGLAIATALIGGALYAYMPAVSAFALESGLSPVHANLSLQIAPRSGKLPNWFLAGRTTLAIPVDVSGFPDAHVILEQLELEIASPAGGRIQAAPPRGGYRDFDKRPLEAFLWLRHKGAFELRAQPDPEALDEMDSSARMLILRFTHPTYDRLRNARVDITGKAGVTFYRLGTKTWMPVGAPVNAPGVGHCSSEVDEGRFSEQMLKVLCESPSGIPQSTRVTLWHPETGREWKQMLGDARTYSAGPKATWLSPLSRDLTYFRMTEISARPDRFTVPSNVPATAKISIVPVQITGYAVLNYQLTGISLADYEVPPPR